MPIRTEIINQAIYIAKGSSTKNYVPICDYCKKVSLVTSQIKHGALLVQTIHMKE